MKPREGFTRPRSVDNQELNLNDVAELDDIYVDRCQELNFNLFDTGGNIDKVAALKYKSQLDDHGYVLVSAFDQNLEPFSFAEYRKLSCFKKKVQVKLESKFNELLADEKGTYSTIMILVMLVVHDKILKYVCHFLEPSVAYIYSLIFPDSSPFKFFPEENLVTRQSRLNDTLKKSCYAFIVAAAATVVPPWIVSIYNQVRTQTFSMGSCLTSRSTFQIDFDSFNESCLIPISYYDNINPAIPAGSNPSNCTGISSVVSDAAGHTWALDVQYFIYSSIIVYGAVLIGREYNEKRYVRAALSLQGTFVSDNFLEQKDDPLDLDHGQDSNATRYTRSCAKLMSFRAIGKKYQGDLLTYLINGGLSPYSDYVFISVLCILFFVTIWFDTPLYRIWYVFPRTLHKQALAFFVKYRSKTSSLPTSISWCDALSAPIKMTYILQTRTEFMLDLLQSVYFLYCSVSLLFQQNQIYNWIVGDELMGIQSDDCAYCGIESFKRRYFSEAMLDDWYIVFVMYPVWSEIIANSTDEYGALLDLLGSQKVEEIKAALDRIKGCLS